MIQISVELCSVLFRFCLDNYCCEGLRILIIYFGVLKLRKIPTHSIRREILLILTSACWLKVQSGAKHVVMNAAGNKSFLGRSGVMCLSVVTLPITMTKMLILKPNWSNHYDLSISYIYVCFRIKRCCLPRFPCVILQGNP